MINCKEASILSTKKAEGMITFKERILLFFHVKMCAMCKLFDKQSQFLSKHAGSKNIEDSDVKLSVEDKKRMNEKLGLK